MEREQLVFHPDAASPSLGKHTFHCPYVLIHTMNSLACLLACMQARATNMLFTFLAEDQTARRDTRTPEPPCGFVGDMPASTQGFCARSVPDTTSHGTATACGEASTQCHHPAGIHMALPASSTTGPHQSTPARGGLHVGSYSSGKKVDAPRCACDVRR